MAHSGLGCAPPLDPKTIRRTASYCRHGNHIPYMGEGTSPNFEAVGATMSAGVDVWQSDIVLKVEPPSDAEIELLKPGAFLATLSRD